MQDLSEQFADYFIQKIVNEEISKIIRSSASKTFELDPIPTWFLKLCLSELLPVITYIVELSLSTSTVPYEFKAASYHSTAEKTTAGPPGLKKLPPCPQSHIFIENH